MVLRFLSNEGAAALASAVALLISPGPKVRGAVGAQRRDGPRALPPQGRGLLRRPVARERRQRLRSVTRKLNIGEDLTYHDVQKIIADLEYFRFVF